MKSKKISAHLSIVFFTIKSHYPIRRLLLYTIFLTVAFTACRQAPGYLEQSLALAGSNRSELEKVLLHYRQNPADSLKYRATVFLISNMPGKYSLDTVSVESNQPYFDALANYLQHYGWYVNDGLIHVCDSIKSTLPENWSKPVPVYSADVKTLSSDFLIRHIDRSFEAWRKYPWSKKVTFEQFCRYILPYNPHTSLWEDAFSYYERRYAFLADSMPDASFQEIGKYIDNEIKQQFTPGSVAWDSYPFLLPANFRNIVTARMGECLDASSASIAALRSVGIPAVLNQIPYWGNSNASHFWTEIPVDNVAVKVKYDNTQRPYTCQEDILVNDMFWINEPVDIRDIPSYITIRYCRTVPKVFRVGS
ncbi:MAG: transglutaminase-like domain-containing protein [Prevotella sp.]|jgi:hypothetical protein|nr:transglutaminase-like domain-containing protein [Prevotella sp.]